MEVVKKNLFSIIFGVIAILAVVAVYWPITGLYADLSSRLDTRVGVSSALDSLANQQRSMPLLNPDQLNADPLTVFPTDPVTAAAQVATDQLKQQAQNMLDLATNTNRHLPLVDGELPQPSDQARFEFANKYAQEIDGYHRWQQILDSTAPPTPAEVQAAKDELHDQINKARLTYDATGNIDPASQADADSQFALESALVQPRMEQERAQQYRIYLLVPPEANPLPVDPDIKVGSEPTPDKICDAQIVIWMLDDVCKAIANANEIYSDPATPGGPPQHDILHSAVKALEGVDAPQPVTASTGFDATAGVSTAVPKLTPISPTGRVCNGLYDVLQFKLHLVVDAAKLPQVLRALQAGQFITVLNVQIIEVVDPARAASNPQGGFRYGSKPCVRVQIDCEELLMHKWTDTILPDSRKNGLGRAALGSPTDNGQGGPPGYGPPGGPPGGSPFGGPRGFGPPGGP